MIGRRVERTRDAATVEAISDSARAPAGPAPGTPQGVVLALQRQIGNAAVTRLLQRQELEAGPEPLEGGAAGTRICATTTSSSTGTGPQRIDRDDPVIHTVAGPCLTHWAGGYYWYVTYQLPFAAQVSGFIIQELYQQGSGGSREHFWEYWEVRAGEREPPSSTRIDTPHFVTPAHAAYDDRYVHYVSPNERQDDQGWYRHVGAARFYPGPLPPQFTSGANQTWQQPDGWTGAGTRHDCYAEWDRRPGHRRISGLVAYAGSQEYRAGDTVNDRNSRPQFGPTTP